MKYPQTNLSRFAYAKLECDSVHIKSERPWEEDWSGLDSVRVIDCQPGALQDVDWCEITSLSFSTSIGRHINTVNLDGIQHLDITSVNLRDNEGREWLIKRDFSGLRSLKANAGDLSSECGLSVEELSLHGYYKGNLDLTRVSKLTLDDISLAKVIRNMDFGSIVDLTLCSMPYSLNGIRWQNVKRLCIGSVKHPLTTVGTLEHLKIRCLIQPIVFSMKNLLSLEITEYYSYPICHLDFGALESLTMGWYSCEHIAEVRDWGNIKSLTLGVMGDCVDNAFDGVEHLSFTAYTGPLRVPESLKSLSIVNQYSPTMLPSPINMLTKLVLTINVPVVGLNFGTIEELELIGDFDKPILKADFGRIRRLKLGDRFNHVVKVWPAMVSLTIGDRFNKPIDKIKWLGLRSLALGSKFKSKLPRTWPITSLTITADWSMFEEMPTEHLEHLDIRGLTLDQLRAREMPNLFSLVLDGLVIDTGRRRKKVN